MGRKRVGQPCGPEEGLAGAAREPVLCAGVEGRGRRQPVLPSRSRLGRRPSAAVMVAGWMGEREPISGSYGHALRPRPGGDPPGTNCQLDRDRDNKPRKLVWKREGSAVKLRLCAGAQGVAGVCQASRREAVSLLIRRLAGAVGIDTNEVSSRFGPNGRLGQSRENPRDPIESLWQERGANESDPW
ncbi:hypothetical protein MPNT_50012 [Candidatus Methylacidithermus pantelleriae]|uniref:Uncharacterized protein n=1 Tax=Candidatus Methylacidithermus pantelleriae TaxID=2744239 RepID=A0A8J2BRP8_9BACT|nr:hypothetical protein MPNT_50012 [Candidatus Methylacidithermus pantelleriae]